MKYWGMFPTSITNAYKPVKSTETATHHVITLILEAAENRKLRMSFSRY